MQTCKIVSLAVRGGLTAALCVLVFGLSGSPGTATDQEPRELVPGLDLWSHKRRAAPRWDPKESTPALLSRAERHRTFMEEGVPFEYRGRKSPYPAALKIIQDGGRLYKSHCMTCHDSRGLGGGEAGRDLTPSPALLAHMVKQPRSVDAYLLWTISDGGAAFGTEMPAFKKILTEQQIWLIVSYMRGGFPVVGETGQD